MNISVSLPIALNKSFDYALPKELENKAALGLRVKVPFGRAVQTGYITALDTKPELPSGVELKSVLSIEDERVLFGKELFPLAHFIEQNCIKWKTECGHCIRRNKYVDRSYENFLIKKTLFSINRNLTIVSCSRWMAKA